MGTYTTDQSLFLGIKIYIWHVHTETWTHIASLHKQLCCSPSSLTLASLCLHSKDNILTYKALKPLLLSIPLIQQNNRE